VRSGGTRPGPPPSTPASRALPPVDEEAPLARLIASRRSRREFTGRRLSDAEVGALLWAGQGITSPDGLRAAPSAGALYPTTLTLVEAGGVWRYSPQEHALSRVRAGDRRADLAAAALGQPEVAEASASVVVTAEPAVLAARYGRRSERYCALEAGHVAQNVLLQAVSLGIAAVPIGAFDDAAVLECVGLGRDHLALYVLAVGWPRPGGR